MKRAAITLCAVALLGGGCAKSSTTTTAPQGPPSIVVTGIQNSVQGNVVAVAMTVSGLGVAKPEGDTSAKTAHYHVFIDREPVALGQVIPKEPGVVHTTDNPIYLRGLSVGMHTFHLVVGDGTHRRITNIDEVFRVDVKGPSVVAKAPATIPAGSALTLQLSAQGVQIVKADGDTSGKTGHYHVFVDPNFEPEEGEMMRPTVPNKIIDTAEPSVTITGLTKGEHAIWVVLSYGNHKSFDIDVMDKLTVTVT
jgi:hypothetical protein